ncbi:hypothetical protein F4808DRAFT_38261 [Astrocystis sublimbata]|nr:hypothetical protein F4808DRAFT_38261 [Astrocystis sublimbata]
MARALPAISIILFSFVSDRDQAVHTGPTYKHSQEAVLHYPGFRAIPNRGIDKQYIPSTSIKYPRLLRHRIL